MGVKNVQFLFDFPRAGADVYLQCPACNHRGVYPSAAAVALFRARNWNQAVDAAGLRFRCSICRHKPAEVRPGDRSDKARRWWLRGARR